MEIDFEPPTCEQCEANEKVFENETHSAFACWYPQMGGYISKAVIYFEKGIAGCFDAYVWHDGDFPFDDKYPRVLHHCEADQFIRFGREVLAMQGAEPENPFPPESPTA